jgi:hypothetical protein
VRGGQDKQTLQDAHVLVVHLEEEEVGQMLEVVVIRESVAA